MKFDVPRIDFSCPSWYIKSALLQHQCQPEQTNWKNCRLKVRFLPFFNSHPFIFFTCIQEMEVPPNIIYVVTVYDKKVENCKMRPVYNIVQCNRVTRRFRLLKVWPLSSRNFWRFGGCLADNLGEVWVIVAHFQARRKSLQRDLYIDSEI